MRCTTTRWGPIRIESNNFFWNISTRLLRYRHIRAHTDPEEDPDPDQTWPDLTWPYLTRLNSNIEGVKDIIAIQLKQLSLIQFHLGAYEGRLHYVKNSGYLIVQYDSLTADLFEYLLTPQVEIIEHLWYTSYRFEY